MPDFVYIYSGNEKYHDSKLGLGGVDLAVTHLLELCLLNRGQMPTMHVVDDRVEHCIAQGLITGVNNAWVPDRGHCGNRRSSLKNRLPMNKSVQ